MQVGSLYSCKWTSATHYQDFTIERGWDMLMFLGVKQENRYYLFYDILRGSKCVLDEGLIKHCKELNKEEQCTQ